MSRDGMLHGINPDISKLIRKARKAGCEVRLTGGNHVRWRWPTGRVYFSAMTGSRRDLTRVRQMFKKEMP